MTKNERTLRRSSESSGTVLKVLGASLAVTFGVTAVAFGGVHAPTRAATHALLALSLVLAASLPSSILVRCGRLTPLIVASSFLLAAVCAGFVPFPSFLGRLLVPAWVD